MTIILALSLAVTVFLYINSRRKFKNLLHEAIEREVAHGKYLDEYSDLLDKWKALPDELKALREINHNTVLAGVQRKLLTQTVKGLKKYPNTVNPDDYTMDEWLTHIQEEAIDLTVYAEVIKQKLEESK